jgi:hypothetical protein
MLFIKFIDCAVSFIIKLYRALMLNLSLLLPDLITMLLLLQTVSTIEPLLQGTVQLLFLLALFCL